MLCPKYIAGRRGSYWVAKGFLDMIMNVSTLLLPGVTVIWHRLPAFQFIIL